MYRGGAYGRWWAGQAAVAKRPSRDAVTTGGVTEADPGPGGYVRSPADLEGPGACPLL